MVNPESKALNIKIMRMWGIFLLPQFYYSVLGIYNIIRSIIMNWGIDGFINMSLESIYLQIPNYLLYIILPIYLLFFGKAAGSLLQHFMDKWPPEINSHPFAYAIRITGLTLLPEFIMLSLALLIWVLLMAFGKQSDTLTFSSIAYSLIYYIVYIAGISYLLFKGTKLLALIRRLIPENADTDLISIKTSGVLLLPSAIISIIYLGVYIFRRQTEMNIYYQDTFSQRSLTLWLDWFRIIFNWAFTFIIPLYLLWGGTGVSNLLKRFMDKWQLLHRNDPAAFYVRILGLYILAIQIKAIINLAIKIISQNQLQEFTRIYNMEGLCNLSSLTSIISITICLCVSWYLLDKGQLVLNFISRKA